MSGGVREVWRRRGGFEDGVKVICGGEGSYRREADVRMYAYGRIYLTTVCGTFECKP